MAEIGIRLRLQLPSGVRFGPGKAELLERVAARGSIAAAGRDMGMSYKRAWSLVEEMNASFTTPLVESSRGGAAGGGARVTDLGTQVLARFRRMEALLAAAEDFAGFATLVDVSGGK